MSFTNEVVSINGNDGQNDRQVDGFEVFAAQAEARLRPVLVARYGVEVGNDVCADAMAYAWEHRHEVLPMTNPVGYLFRVAQSAARRHHRWSRTPELPPAPPATSSEPDPGLHDALRLLSEDQRVAVVLVHGYGWSYEEVADVQGVPISTVRNHLHRGLKRLRRVLEDSHGQ